MFSKISAQGAGKTGWVQAIGLSVHKTVVSAQTRTDFDSDCQDISRFLLSSVVKSPAELDIDLPRVVKVESSEGQAVVEQYAAIGHVQGGQRKLVSVALAKTFSDGNVKRSVLGQIVARILRVRRTIGESRAVVYIG